MRRLCLLCPLLFSSCGYRLGPGERTTVSIPYVVGDYEGKLTTALVQELASSPYFDYCRNGGKWILKVEVVNDRSERIGFRFDRKLGEKKKNQNSTKPELVELISEDKLIAVESRKEITVEVFLFDGLTEEPILGPQKVKATADYDYIDPNNPFSVGFRSLKPTRISTISFSLGQLDSVGAAGEDASFSVFTLLARKIVSGMLALEDAGDE